MKENKQEEDDMMNLIVEQVDVWAAGIDDKPGGLAKVLSGLRDAGVDLGFVIARRAPDKPGSGVVFVTPLRGDREVRAASILGFNVTNSIKSVRVEGDNRRSCLGNSGETCCRGDQPPWILRGCYRGEVHPVHWSGHRQRRRESRRYHQEAIERNGIFMKWRDASGIKSINTGDGEWKEVLP